MLGVRGTGDTSGYGGLTKPVQMPGHSTPPYGGWMDDVATALAEASRSAGIESAVEKVVVHRGRFLLHYCLLRTGQPRRKPVHCNNAARTSRRYKRNPAKSAAPACTEHANKQEKTLHIVFL
jgi:hypothetical protein